MDVILNYLRFFTLSFGFMTCNVIIKMAECGLVNFGVTVVATNFESKADTRRSPRKANKLVNT